MSNQSNQNNNATRQWGSRFGYLMVAAGAAIGLGNIWRFPYLAYEGGGGVFLVVYIIVVILMGHPMVEMETAIGRYTGKDTVTCFQRIHKKWGFAGWMAVICTTLLCMYYVVVGGWVAKYAFQYIVSGDFGSDKQAYYDQFTSSAVEPIIWTLLLLALVSFLLYFGITNTVEKISKVMLPLLFALLIICGIWALFVNDNAIEGVKYYLLPDFSKFSFTTFAQAATQVLFSIGIGWGLYETLGANISKENNLKSDAIMVSVFDTAAAILAGFDHLRSSVLIATPFTPGAPEMDHGCIPGISAKVPVDLLGHTRGELRENEVLLKQIAEYNLNQLKRFGDWTLFPRVADDFSEGKFQISPEGVLLYEDSPVLTVDYSSSVPKPVPLP